MSNLYKKCNILFYLRTSHERELLWREIHEMPFCFLNSGIFHRVLFNSKCKHLERQVSVKHMYMHVVNSSHPHACMCTFCFFPHRRNGYVDLPERISLKRKEMETCQACWLESWARARPVWTATPFLFCKFAGLVIRVAFAQLCCDYSAAL